MKIKVNFTIPTKDFKDSEYVALPVEMIADFNEPLSGQFEFKMQIPDFMFKELADTESQFKTEYDPNNRKVSGCFAERDLTYKFKKTQTSKNLDVLKDYISGLTTFLLDKYSVETETMKKKIFIRFNHSANHITNGLNGAYNGEQIAQNFNYFIGYEVMTDKFTSLSMNGKSVQKRYITKIEYHSPISSLKKRDTNFKEVENLFLPLPRHNQSIESFEKEYSIIDWSEEREEFCQKINEAFKKVNSELESFLKEMNNDKIDALIQSGNLKLLK
jgi:hypothetical protein